jgi:2,4-dienoyl-CoA reductase-like NADH-dependent reductase (Old Yellow Enzyme family)
VSVLFSPIRLGGLALANRVVVSPMCQYSARDGVAQPWHWQHVGSLAISGAGAVILEATAVEPSGRIAPEDLGLWGEPHQTALTRLIADIRTYSRTPIGVQLAHAGRKAAVRRPWEDGGAPLPADDPRAWPLDGPSALPFSETSQVPAALDEAGLARIRDAFAAAAGRADACGFDLVELHAAHGYLLHEFVSALSNRRTDAYGGPLENRLRFPLEVARAIRAAWPKTKALGARITGSDWTEGGVTPDEAAAFAAALEREGFDYVCVSSGGNVPHARIPGRELGYQAPFARVVREAVGIPVMSVGMIVDPHQAEEIVAGGDADLVALARAMLDDPRWPLHAAAVLGAEPAYPHQYERAGPGLWAGYPAASEARARRAG